MRSRRTIWTAAAAAVVVLVAGLTVAGRQPDTARAAALDTRTATGQFEVVGSKIYDPSGTQFVPVGSNLNGPHSFFWSPTKGRSATLRQWGMNLIRLVTCNPGGCHGADAPVNNDLDGIVEEYTAAKMVVMIDYHQLGFGQSASPADIAAAVTFWTAMAQRFKGNPYVWFNLYNEPEAGPGAAQRWRNQHQPVIDAIRGQGANNILVLDDTHAGQGAADWWQIGNSPSADSGAISEGPNLRDPAKRLVFSVHTYDVWGFPNGNDRSCQTRYTDAQRDARFASYVERVQAVGPLLIGELGFRPTDSATSGVSYHGDLTGGHPPCGSTNLLAAQTAYRVAPRYDVGVIVWPGFPLTTNGAENYDLNGTNPTNLTPLGRLHLDFGRAQAARSSLGGASVTTTTARPATTVAPATTGVPATTAPATTTPATTAAPTTTAAPATTVTTGSTTPPSMPPADPTAVLVVGDAANLTDGDRSLASRLRSALSARVTVVDDDGGARSGRPVVIAPSADPVKAGTAYRSIAAPMLQLNGGGWAAAGLTSAAGSPVAPPARGGQPRLSSTGVRHPVLSGPSGWLTGDFAPALGGDGLAAAADSSLGAGAVGLLAGGTNGATKAAFAYAKGAKLAGGSPAPDKRVGLGYSEAMIAKLSGPGWAAIDNALTWLISPA